MPPATYRARPDRDNYLVVVADCARVPGASPNGFAERYPSEIGEESLPMLRLSAVGDQTSLIRCARCWARDLRWYEPTTRTLRMPGSRSERPNRNGALPGTTRTPEPTGQRTTPSSPMLPVGAAESGAADRSDNACARGFPARQERLSPRDRRGQPRPARRAP